MARANLVFCTNDFSDDSTPSEREQLDAFFERMRPIFGSDRIPDAAAGFAIIARIPKLANLITGLNEFMARECPWTSQRADLRELSIQTLNLHFQCDFNYQSHLAKAENLYNLPVELQAAIPLWKVTNIFSDEQRLVIEYTLASIQGSVTDELFARVTNQFGEQGAVEFTAGIAWWSFWAILVGAIGPQHDFGYGNPKGDQPAPMRQK